MPNLISLTALLLSWVSIVLLLNQRFYLSFSMILMAFIMDALDGFLARKLKTESLFGRQLDSNVDIFVFLVYPALSFYLYFGLKDTVSVAVTLVFIGAGVFRLARFNIIGFLPLQDKGHMAYPGLPVFFSHFAILALLALKQLPARYFVPSADALILATGISMALKSPFPKPRKIWPFLLAIIAASLTMFFMDYYATH